MASIDRVGRLTLVVDGAPENAASRSEDYDPLVHIYVDDRFVDAKGRVCLTPPGVRLSTFCTLVDVLCAQLDILKARALERRDGPPHPSPYIHALHPGLE